MTPAPTSSPIPRVPAGSIVFILEISINNFDSTMQTNFKLALSTLYDVENAAISISEISAYVDTTQRRRLLTVEKIRVTVDISTEYIPSTTNGLANAMLNNNLPTASVQEPRVEPPGPSTTPPMSENFIIILSVCCVLGATVVFLGVYLACNPSKTHRNPGSVIGVTYNPIHTCPDCTFHALQPENTMRVTCSCP